MTRLRRRLIALGIGLLVLAVADRIALHTLLASGEVRGIRLAPYAPPLFHRAQDAALEELRAKLASDEPSWMPFDRALGWEPRANTEFGLYAYDDRGARIGNPEGERPSGPNTRRVAAFGCSFTQGDEVAGADCWAAQLERIGDVRIENMGVSGYGLDQALLRMRKRLASLEVDEVWLGFLPSAGLRVSTCYRPLVRPWSKSLAFKSRFEVAADDSLEFVLNPAVSASDIVTIMDDPGDFLLRMRQLDPWVARRPAAFAPLGSRALHRSALGRLFLTWDVRSAPDPVAALENTSSRTFRTLLALMQAAKREVEAGGLAFRVINLPGPADLRAVEERGNEHWAKLAQAARDAGIEWIEAGALLTGPGDELFVSHDGHYSARGNELVAQALKEALSIE